MKIIIFYIFLILIFIPIIFNSIFITRTVEGFKGEKKEKKKKNKEVIYKMIGDSFIYGKNTIELLPSNKKDKITDLYFHYRSLPDKSIANGNTFDDISSQEFIVKTPKNKYKISFSSSKKPITIILNETEYMIELEKKDKEGKFDILWFNKVAGTIDGFDIKLTEKKLDDVEVVMVLYTAILIIKKMKDLDNVDYNKMFK
jgi:hypothetical protein